MARKLRVQYPGAVYHVMNRGDRQEDIFQSEKLARLGWGLDLILNTHWHPDHVMGRRVWEINHDRRRWPLRGVGSRPPGSGYPHST